ncbi:hypothetical protein EVAR_38920_1 [Eumeta japonica]|uniref:Uncharacterized protein n=1 Tax=Eumeta variegata TaxID=151549 RepID=A0A4C1ZS80_EUMVA|nr:hypothetical protein EVAR_38920_1 [Eumeta japonica]
MSCWSDLMEEIRRRHKAFWSVTKAPQNGGYNYPLKRPTVRSRRRGGSGVPCRPLSRLNRPTPHDPAHISRIEEEVLKTSLEPKDDLTPVSLQRSPTAEIAQDQKGTGP